MTDILDAGINFQHPDAPAPTREQQTALSSPAHQVAQQEGVPPAEPQAPTAAEPEPTRKYAGKYTSIEEFERGYWNSAQEAKRLAEENRFLKDIQTAGTRVNPAERVTERNEYLEELRDAAIPVDALDKLIEERANRIVQKAFEPLIRGTQARATMIEQFPDFEQKERELNSFLSANPSVNDKYNRMMAAGLEDAALEYAYLNFTRGQSRSVPTDASGQEQAAARATAALTGNSVGAREVGDSFENKLAAARARFERDGDERALAAVVFSGIHPDVPSR